MFKSILLISLFGLLLRVISAKVTQSISEFQKEALEFHNSYRADHGAPAMVLDESLNKMAIEWAEHLASNNLFEHRQNSGFGENIYKSSGLPVTGRTAIDAWMEEEKNYDYKTGNSKDGKVIGHFTQVVWKGSQKLGIGFAEGSDGSTYVVANYSPPGNYPGKYLENVSEEGGKADDDDTLPSSAIVPLLAPLLRTILLWTISSLV